MSAKELPLSQTCHTSLVAEPLTELEAEALAHDGPLVSLLHAGPAWIWALAAGTGITALVLFGAYATIQQVFKLLCLAPPAYVIVLFAAHVPWRTVGLNMVAPHITWSKDYLALLVAALGTTISPYLFFWQTANRVEEMRVEDEGGDRTRPLARRSTPGAKRKQRNARIDVFTGMGFSNLVMFAIITAAAVAMFILTVGS